MVNKKTGNILICLVSVNIVVIGRCVVLNMDIVNCHGGSVLYGSALRVCLVMGVIDEYMLPRLPMITAGWV